MGRAARSTMKRYARKYLQPGEYNLEDGSRLAVADEGEMRIFHRTLHNNETFKAGVKLSNLPGPGADPEICVIEFDFFEASHNRVKGETAKPKSQEYLNSPPRMNYAVPGQKDGYDYCTDQHFNTRAEFEAYYKERNLLDLSMREFKVERQNLPPPERMGNPSAGGRALTVGCDGVGVTGAVQVMPMMSKVGSTTETAFRQVTGADGSRYTVLPGDMPIPLESPYKLLGPR